jgi:poly(A) polymerase
MSDRPRRAPSARPPTSPEAPTSEPSPSDLSSSPAGSSSEAVPSDARPPRRKSRATRSTRPDESQLAETAASEPTPTRASTSRGSNGAPAAVEGARRERGGRRQRSGDDLEVGYQVGPAPDAPLASSDDDRGPRPVVEPVWPRFAVTLDESRIDPDVQKVAAPARAHGHEAYLVGGCVRDLLARAAPKGLRRGHQRAPRAGARAVPQLARHRAPLPPRARALPQAARSSRSRPSGATANDDGDEILGPSQVTRMLIRSRQRVRRGPRRRDAARLHHQRAVLRSRGSPDPRLGRWYRDDVRRRVVQHHRRARGALPRRPGPHPARAQVRGSPRPRHHARRLRRHRALPRDLGAGRTPRVSEEILRLLRGGQARRTIFLAWETGVLDVLLPESSLAALRRLERERGEAGSTACSACSSSSIGARSSRRADDTVLWTLLLLEPIKEASEGARDRSTAVSSSSIRSSSASRSPPRRRRHAPHRSRCCRASSPAKPGASRAPSSSSSRIDVAEADLYARGLSTDAIKALRSAPREAAPRETGGRASAAKDEPARAAASTGRGHRASSHGRSRPTPRH